MAATLEEMARALYRSWFVDFDPVHAKAQGRAPAHMDPATAALFPARFGDDGLPEGWRREALQKHVRTAKGLSYKGKGLCESTEGLPLHNLNSIKVRGGYEDAGIKFYREDFRERHLVRPGDLVVANTDLTLNEIVIGYAALVPEHHGPRGLYSHHLYRVDFLETSPLSGAWLLFALNNSPLGQEIRGYANGTTVSMLPADALQIPRVVVPPRDVIEAFDRQVQPLMRRQGATEEQNRTLAALRDTLLPKLMSGELRVREAEAQVKEAV